MKKTEILNGNKIIVMFMLGASTTEQIEELKAVEGKNQLSACYALSESYDLMKYHESWDWLMPVVEKIEVHTMDWNGDKIKHFDFRIQSKYCLVEGYTGVRQNGVYYQTAYGSSPESKIEEVYNAIVEMIKFFNDPDKYMKEKWQPAIDSLNN